MAYFAIEKNMFYPLVLFYICMFVNLISTKKTYLPNNKETSIPICCRWNEAPFLIFVSQFLSILSFGQLNYVS